MSGLSGVLDTVKSALYIVFGSTLFKVSRTCINTEKNPMRHGLVLQLEADVIMCVLHGSPSVSSSGAFFFVSR